MARREQRGVAWWVEAGEGFLDHARNPLSDQAKVLFLILEWFARRKCYCYPPNKKLVGMAGKKERAVRDSLEELEKAGWIQREFFEGQKKGRTGIIMRRRSMPGDPAATTKEEFDAARAALDQERSGRPSRQKSADSSRQKFATKEASPTGRRSRSMAHGSPPAGAGSAVPEADGRKIVDYVERSVKDIILAGGKAADVRYAIFNNNDSQDEINRLARGRAHEEDADPVWGSRGLVEVTVERTLSELTILSKRT